MKILVISNIPSPYRIDFFNELGKEVDLTVIFEAKTAKGISFNWNLDQIKYFKAIFLENGDIREKRINFRIIKYIKKNHFDEIIITSYAYLTEMTALVALKIRKIPYCLEIDGGIIRNESSLKRFFKTYLISNAKCYFSPSKSSDEYLIHYGAKQDKIYRYPFTSIRKKEILSSPTNDELKLNIRKELGIEGDKIAIAVGQFIHRKGFDILINAWKSVDPAYQLIIIGNGELKNKYITLIKEQGIMNIKILDFLDKQTLLQFYKAADLFILPTREDIWGLVINEAMANALPVITTDKCVAGIELVSENENGFIVNSNDTLMLSKKISIILENDILRDRMSLKSLKVINKYSIENMAIEHIKKFKQK